MSDFIKHECGIVIIRLLKPLSYYREKYGTYFYGVEKTLQIVQKMKNRGQDGAGIASIKFDMEPGYKYMSRLRSNKANSIEALVSGVKKSIDSRENFLKEKNKEDATPDEIKEKMSFVGELFMGHVRYGTHGNQNIESVHPSLRVNNWKSRNLLMAGNFNLTNVDKIFESLIKLGQHPKENSDSVTIMENLGHFLDEEVVEKYRIFKKQGYSKVEASQMIESTLDLQKVLKRASKKWDGGYVMGGLLGHGDCFVLRDPKGIRPVYVFRDDEILVACSERAPIQTCLSAPFEKIMPLEPGCALVCKRDGDISINKIRKKKREYTLCSFERIYFSRSNDKDIYRERKMLGKLLTNEVLESVNYDFEKTVYSFIPNSSESAFYGLIDGLNEFLNEKRKALFLQKEKVEQKEFEKWYSASPKIEKTVFKEITMRTFISTEKGRHRMVNNAYDINYGGIKEGENVVLIDDSIVRGTTLKQSILKIVDEQKPKKIVIVSSAPQIKYPDCYGINMPKFSELAAFKAMVELHIQDNREDEIHKVYKKCIDQNDLENNQLVNFVQELYANYTDLQISNQIAKTVSSELKAEVQIIFQTIENLHKSCPEHKGDWYFSGNYPTKGGNRMVNMAFIDFYEKEYNKTS